MKSTHTRLNVEDLPGSASVPAGGAVLLSAEYEALSESASEGDIVATAVFSENMTGRQLTNTTSYWYVKSNGTMIGQMHPFSINPSVFTISADGSLTVERFGYIATRGTNDVSSIIRSP